MAYFEVIIKSVEANPDGSQRVNLAYLGDAGEPPVPDTQTVYVSAVPDQDAFRRQVIAKVTALNATRTYKNFLVAGAVIDISTPLPVPVVTKEQQAQLAYQQAVFQRILVRKAFVLKHVQQSAVDAADAAAAALYKPGYESLLGPFTVL